MKLSGRHTAFALFLHCAIFVALSCSAQLYAQTPAVRMKWEDFIAGPAGATRLDHLKKAIRVMKSLDTSTDPVNFRRSWAYWANIHGYYGPQSPDGTVEQQIDWLNQNGYSQYVPYYDGITDQTPPDSVATTTWATCQHSGGQQSQQAQNFFLWHRMYLYYFEKVLQWASGDPALRLPYWNYTDPADLAIPAEIRKMDSVFYDQKRDPGMNAGTSQLSSIRTDIDAAMKISDYLNFEFKIERGIHGYVHCTVGPTCPVAHMGDVPLAGNDPVFYTHHANIDRIFACWETKYGIPAGSWSTQTFSFPDENGVLQTQPVSDFLDTTKLGYVYDNESKCTRTPALRSAAIFHAVQAAPTELGSSQAVSVDKPEVSVDIALPAKPKTGLLAAPVAGPVYLVLSDITADGPPGTLIDVYIANKKLPARKLYVGTISWFNDFGVGHHHAGKLDKTEEYEVTDQLKKLGAATLANVTVTFDATSGRAATKPANTAALHAADLKAFRPDAHLKIGSITLRKGAAPSTPEK